MNDINGEQKTKKLRQNTCTVCLGLFRDELLEEIDNKIKCHPDLSQYNCSKIITAVSIPILLQLRQLSVWIDLLETFKEHFDKETGPPDTNIKDAFRSIISAKTCAATGKYSDPNGIMVTVTLTYHNEDEELLRLSNVKPELFRERKQNKKVKDFITRAAFEKHFTPVTVSMEKFTKEFKLDIPEHEIKLTDISIRGPTVFVAGRYQKFSRELSQTPWILNGKRIMESSVQELIMVEVAKYFKVDATSTIFSASGREDCDVRCLGKGRPFLIEIPDAKEVELPDQVAANIESSINSGHKIAIRDLQVVSRDSTIHLKAGEEDKRKVYQALCVINRPVTDDVLEKLNKPEGFEIQQTTPLRVLHRRPLHVRPRMIHSMHATRYSDHVRALVLYVETQAGTYIKELVHGELGRTEPSCRSILQEDIDIVALDVVAIDLDWPKEMKR